MSGDKAIERGIAALIRAHCPDAGDVTIDGLTAIIGGNSSEIWSFDAHWTQAGEQIAYPLILRRGSLNEFGSAGRAAEFQLLQALVDTPVAAPKAVWFDADGAFLERPSMVMERASGAADRNLLRDNNKLGLDVAARTGIAGKVAEMLAGIHRVDVAALDLADGMKATAHPALQQLAFYDAEIRRQEVEPMPELRLASLWLHEHLPDPPTRTVLVHGDFRPANLLIDDGEIEAVLDWEFAHEGDPAEDLGWYFTRYYAREHFIPGRWTTVEFLASYEAALGAAVDRKALRFWSVFALYKLASMTLAALRAFAGGDHSRMAPSPQFIIEPLLQSLVEEEEAR